MSSTLDSSARRMLLRAVRTASDISSRMVAPAVGLYDGATCTDVRFSDSLGGISVAAAGADDGRIIIHFHGGAHCMGSVWTTREMIGRLSASTRAHVVSVNYRLAPENPFPAGLEDALTAWRWVRERYPHASVAVAGESAGGNLAFALLVRLAQLQELQPVACVTMSPWLLLDTDTVTQRDNHETNKKGTLRNIWDNGAARMVERYCQNHQRKDPLVSPLFAADDLVQCFPPVLLHAAADEPLAADASDMARLCERSGVITEFELFPGSLHCFQAVPNKKESKESFEKINSFLEQHW